MKKFFIYIAAALSLAACSSEEKLIEEEEKEKIEKIDYSQYDELCYTIMPEVKTNVTRSVLAYDFSKSTTVFSWTTDPADNIGVFPVTQGSLQQEFKIDEIAEGSGGKLGVFGKRQDGDFVSFDKEKRYVAYYPLLKKDGIDYSAIPISYEDQRQTGAPYIFYYRNRNTHASYPDIYNESERTACGHLPEKDYLVAGPTDPTAGGKLHLQMTRMSAIVRFYIVIPDQNLSYDMLQVFSPNKEKPFVMETTMDAEHLKLADTPTKTAYSAYLKLGADGVGLNLGEHPVGLVENPYKYSDTYKHVLVAYMMAAPRDFSDTDCVLYLHSKSGTDEHKVYKAALARKNLRQDYVNQWTVTGVAEDEPIKFLSITVQQWTEETEISNEGNGTETW